MYHLFKDFPVAQRVKNLPAMQETRVQSLGQEDPLEKGMATHSSILVWRITGTEKPGGLQFVGSQRVGHNWATNTHIIFLSFLPAQAQLPQSCPTLLWPHGLQPAQLLSQWDSPRENTGVSGHALLQGIFLSQESNPSLLCFLHCRHILYRWATWKPLNIVIHYTLLNRLGQYFI